MSVTAPPPVLARPRPPAGVVALAIASTLAFVVAAVVVAVRAPHAGPHGYTYLGTSGGVKVWARRTVEGGHRTIGVVTSRGGCDAGGPDEYDGIALCLGGVPGKEWAMAYVVPKAAASARIQTNAGPVTLDVLGTPTSWPNDVAIAVVTGSRAARAVVPTSRIVVRDTAGRPLEPVSPVSPSS